MAMKLYHYNNFLSVKRFIAGSLLDAATTIAAETAGTVAVALTTVVVPDRRVGCCLGPKGNWVNPEGGGEG
jgi:hypothetical protein